MGAIILFLATCASISSALDCPCVLSLCTAPPVQVPAIAVTNGGAVTLQHLSPVRDEAQAVVTYVLDVSADTTFIDKSSFSYNLSRVLGTFVQDLNGFVLKGRRVHFRVAATRADGLCSPYASTSPSSFLFIGKTPPLILRDSPRSVAVVGPQRRCGAGLPDHNSPHVGPPHCRPFGQTLRFDAAGLRRWHRHGPAV
jgi:hypothetical protein